MALAIDSISITQAADAPIPVLLGDCNFDGIVNFLDISPFVGLLTSGVYVEQADCNEDGVFKFLGISSFIALLTATQAISSGN